METNSIKLIGKLLFNNSEILLTSSYTIIGRTSDVVFSKDLKGNIHFEDYYRFHI